MSIQIVPLGPEHLPAMVRFSQKRWDGRPGHESFYRWRYLDAPAQTTFMALSGDDCLAVLSVFARPYLVAGEEILCSETADWHCLQELRGSGVGIRLMRRVMDLGRPILAVDGSNDTRRLLPRLGWREVGRAMRFVRLLRVDSLRRELRRRLWMRQAERRSALGRLGRIREQLLVRLFRPGSPRPPAGGAALCATSLDEGVRAAYDDRVECGTLPLPLPAQIDWLARAATPGRCFACLNFRIDGVLRGWGLIRVDEVGETVEAALLELFSPEPALYDWMVGEAVAIAAGLGAHRITSISSCPTLALALRRNHFWAREQTPIHCWVERGVFPLAPLHLGLNIGDAALLPYPRPWPSYASVAGA